MSTPTKPSIVFCHGIWADGSCWNKLTGPLQAEGYEVIAAQYGLDTNEADVAATRATLGRVHSPAILVGHSYGGAVITAAGTDDRVAGLVYISALGPDETETSQSEQEKFPQTPLFGQIEVADGRIWMLPSGADLLLRGPARGRAENRLGDRLPPVRRAVRPQRPGRSLEDQAVLVHRGQPRPGRAPRPGAGRRQADGRHHLRHRQQPRPHALPARLRPRRHPRRRSRHLSPRPFLSPCSSTGASRAQKERAPKEKPVASEQVLDIPVRRHVLTSERPFQVVLDGIYAGISQPDIGALFARLAASTSYEEFTALVRQAQGSAGLMRFLHLDDDHVLALDPQADQAGRRLVRLIAGNPVTMGQMTRHLPAAGSYAPVTILIQELPGGRTQVAYDTVASAIAPYGDAAASQVAGRLDTEVLALLHHATGMPATATAARRSRRTP